MALVAVVEQAALVVKILVTELRGVTDYRLVFLVLLPGMQVVVQQVQVTIEPKAA
jgi:hypothetical protein